MKTPQNDPPLALPSNEGLGVNADGLTTPLGGLGRRPYGCRCRFTTYMVGDGCEACNPAKALKYATHRMADLQAHRDMLDQALREAIGIIEELCTAHKHPEPEASMTRMQKALDFDA